MPKQRNLTGKPDYVVSTVDCTLFIDSMLVKVWMVVLTHSDPNNNPKY